METLIIDLICISLLLIFDLMGVAITISFIILIIKNKTSSTSQSKSIILSAIAIFSFTLASILFTAASVYQWLYGESELESFIGVFGFGFYFMGETILLIIFILRINHTFKHTALQSSPCVITSLYLFAFVLIVLFVLLIFSIIIDGGFFIVIFAGLWSILYIILSIMLMSLFVRKIESLMIMSKPSENEQTSDIEKQQQIKSMIDQDILYIVIKHSLLISFAICCTFTLLILSIVVMFFNISYIAVVIIVLDCLVSSICTYLLFGITKKIYDKICRPFHKCCEDRKLAKIERTHRGMRRRTNNAMEIKMGNLTATGTHVNEQSIDTPI